MEMQETNKNTFIDRNAWRYKMKNWFSKHGFALILGSLIVAYIFLLVFPLGWAVMSSFKTYRDFLEYPFSWPKKWVLDNYIRALNEVKVRYHTGEGISTIYMEGMLVYSLLFSIALPLATVIPTMCIGYVLAKYKFWFNKILYGSVIVVMILPIVGSLASEIQLLKALGLYDTFFGLVVLKFSYAGSWCLIFYGAFSAISWDYAEAVFIDGGGHFTVFFKIMMPFVSSTALTLYVIMALSHWNDYNLSLIYAPSMPSLAYGLYYAKFALPDIQRETMSFASSFILTAPMVVFFVCFQKRLMGDIKMGGLKG